MKTLVTKLAATMATVAIPLTGIVFADTHGFTVDLGYRQDSVQWKMEDRGEVNPRPTSNLHFKDLEIFELGVGYKGLLGCSYARARFDYGWILDGRLREQFELKDRFSGSTGRFDHDAFITEGDFIRGITHNKVKSTSYVWDLNIAIGMPFDLDCEHLQIAPLIGFSYDRQNIRVRGREHVRVDGSGSSELAFVEDSGFGSSSKASSADSDISSSSDSNHRHHGSKFRTAWWGPWVGFDVSYNCECVNLYGEFEFHFGRAERERNSNTDEQYVDRYKRTKSFWGPSLRVGTNYLICEDWYVDGSVGYKQWFSHSSRDHFYWKSADIRFDIGYIF